MNFFDIFSKNRKQQSKPSEAPEHWIKCQECQSLMYFKEIANQFKVCPKCGFHMRIGAQERVDLISDEGSFVEFDESLSPTDPLKFVDKKSYKKRISEAQQKTGRNSSLIGGECTINGKAINLICFDFSFMGGSLGSVEGERIVRAVNRCIEKKQPLVIVSASGGARMQESTYSLLQMSKTSAAIKRLSEHKIPYISVLTDPTMGGVSASFAWLGDIIIAEPGALIGFAGERVIKQTIGTDLPEGFQRSEFLLEHGLIDMIVKRGELKKTIYDLLNYLEIEKEEIEIEIEEEQEILEEVDEKIEEEESQEEEVVEEKILQEEKIDKKEDIEVKEEKVQEEQKEEIKKEKKKDKKSFELKLKK